MHGAGLGVPAAHQGQEGVLQEFAARWEGGQAAGLGHGHQVCIFKQDRCGQGHLGFDPGGPGPHQPLARPQGFAPCGHPLIEEDLAQADAFGPLVGGAAVEAQGQVGAEVSPSSGGADLLPISVSAVGLVHALFQGRPRFGRTWIIAA